MSVMHQDGFDIAYKSKIESDLLIINQCDKDGYEEITVNGFLWRMIYTTERGLSKSRNMALKNARGEICLLADDDEVFSGGYATAVVNAFNEVKNADVLVFNLNRTNVRKKRVYYKIKKVKKAPWYRGYNSPMIAFKLNNIYDKISFNERFGSGTEWGGGEDILFLESVRKNYMKIYEYPFVIATIDYSKGSNWFSGFNEKYFYNLGAYDYFYYGKRVFLRELRCLYDAIYRTRSDKRLSIRNKLKWIHRGMKGFKNNVTYKEFLAERDKNE